MTLVSTSLFAQEKSISGRVTGVFGEPISNVEVLYYSNYSRAQAELEHAREYGYPQYPQYTQYTQYSYTENSGEYNIYVEENGYLLFCSPMYEPVLKSLQGSDLSRVDVTMNSNLYLGVLLLRPNTSKLPITNAKVTTDIMHKVMVEPKRPVVDYANDLLAISSYADALIGQKMHFFAGLKELPDYIDDSNASSNGHSCVGVEIQDYIEVIEEMVEEESIPFQLEVTMPSLSGKTSGDFLSWLSTKLKLPKSFGYNCTAKVFVKVDEEGNLSNYNVVCDNELLKQSVTEVLRRSPKWIPGCFRDRKTTMQLSFDIVCQLPVNHNQLSKKDVADLHSKFSALEGYEKLKDLCTGFTDVDEMRYVMFDRLSDPSYLVAEDEIVKLDYFEHKYSWLSSKIESCKCKLSVCEAFGFPVSEQKAKLAEIEKKVDAADQLGVAINYVPFTAYEMAQNYLYECDKDGFFKSKAMMHHFIKSFFK